MIYSKGNQSTQYNLSSAVNYSRERWGTSATYDSTLASSTGTSPATRNEINLGLQRLLRFNNWYYSGLADFLQSSEQGIRLQTGIGGAIGRYLRNNNRAVISVFGGLVWQRINYEQKIVPAATQDVASSLIGAEINSLILTRRAFRSAPISCPLSPNPVVSISTSTLRITSNCGAISTGTFRSTVTGTIVPRLASLAATTAPALASPGRLGAVEDRKCFCVFREERGSVPKQISKSIRIFPPTVTFDTGISSERGLTL